MPILGIMASAMSANLWAPAGAYDSLSSITLSASASSVTFSNIPSTYTHLQIRATARCDAAVTIRNSSIRFNGDSATNYSVHELSASGSGSGGSAGYATQAEMEGFLVPGTSFGASVFGVTVIDILDYAKTNKYKTLRALSGVDNNGSGSIYMYSGSWRNTAAITSINLAPSSNYVQYSSFALYGIK
jgi:hypothetical protein